MKPEDIEQITQQRDALQSIVGGSQKREAETELTLQLLVLRGDVTQQQVDQARAFAKAKPSNE